MMHAYKKSTDILKNIKFPASLLVIKASIIPFPFSLIVVAIAFLSL